MRAFRLLKPNEIEVRVSEIKETDSGNFVKLLLYKTARTDAALLDERYGAENWQNDYKCIDGKLFCGIGIRYYDEWIWKWNVGTESNMEAEKGQASDALKRAAFVLGLGAELYSAPDIRLYHPKATIKKNNKGKLVCYDRFSVRLIEYDADQNISKLVIHNDSTGMDVYSWTSGTKAPGSDPPPEQEQEKETPPQATGAPITCESCGKTWEPYPNTKGQMVTVERHAEISRKKCYGKVLCPDCAVRYLTSHAKAEN